MRLHHDTHEGGYAARTGDLVAQLPPDRRNVTQLLTQVCVWGGRERWLGVAGAEAAAHGGWTMCAAYRLLHAGTLRAPA